MQLSQRRTLFCVYAWLQRNARDMLNLRNKVVTIANLKQALEQYKEETGNTWPDVSATLGLKTSTGACYSRIKKFACQRVVDILNEM